MSSPFELTSQQIKLAILKWLAGKPNGDDKYNIIGKAGRPVGVLESQFGGRFDSEQRHLASKCFDELRSADLIRSTYGSNSRPEDWVVITDKGRVAFESGLKEPISMLPQMDRSETSEQDILPKHGVDVAAKYIFLDIVGFTNNRTTEAQADIIKQLNEIVSETIKHKSIPSENIIFIPTGDGICIALLNIEHPVDNHIQVALAILARLNKHNVSTQNETRRFQVRVGINADTDTLVVDINHRQNIAGAGINMASRIMSLADGNQILVGQPVYNTLRNREKYTSAFKAFHATVKHDTQITVYQFISSEYEGLDIAPPTRCQADHESQTRKEEAAIHPSANLAGSPPPPRAAQSVTGSGSELGAEIIIKSIEQVPLLQQSQIIKSYEGQVITIQGQVIGATKAAGKDTTLNVLCGRVAVALDINPEKHLGVEEIRKGDSVALTGRIKNININLCLIYLDTLSVAKLD